MTNDAVTTFKGVQLQVAGQLARAKPYLRILRSIAKGVLNISMQLKKMSERAGADCGLVHAVDCACAGWRRKASF